MASFTGFPSGRTPSIPIPESFFTDLLPEIDNLAELKVTLHAIWLLDHQEGTIRYLQDKDFMEDDRFMQGMNASRDAAGDMVEDALERACQRGSLIFVNAPEGRVYFLNSPRGRASAEGLSKGSWTLSDHPQGGMTLEMARPNLYTLYEKNIGPLTPIIAQTINEAEQNYPSEWIEEAIRTAVLKNARNWKYIEAILRSWKEKGHDEKDRRDSQEDRRKYIEGEYADFIEH